MYTFIHWNANPLGLIIIAVKKNKVIIIFRIKQQIKCFPIDHTDAFSNIFSTLLSEEIVAEV